MFKKKNTPIYFDFAASTPISESAFDAMKPWLDGTHFGNASSIHARGKKAREVVEKSRQVIKDAIGATRESKLVFTSGGTESNVLAITGSISREDTVLVSQIEHSSIFGLVENGISCKTIHVKTNGVIDLDDLRKKLLEHKPKVLSIMLVNNELGTVQPIKKIVEITRELSPKTLIHTDASQAFSYMSCNVEALGVDMMSLCSQKMYGPQGIGALYLADTVAVNPLFPGAQEYGIRGGTEPVALITGFTQAVVQSVKKRTEYIKNMSAHKRYLIDGLNSSDINYVLHGRDTLARACSMSFPDCDLDSEALVSFLNTKKIYVSSKSACMGSSEHDSHVQLAIGNVEKNTIRLSFGITTTKKEVDRFITVIKDVC